MNVIPPNAFSAAALPVWRSRMGRPLGLRLRWHLMALGGALVLPLPSFALIEANEVSDARRAASLAQMQAFALVNAEGVQQGLAQMRTVAQMLALSPDLLAIGQHAPDMAAFRRGADQVAQDRGVSIALRNRSGAQITATRVAPAAPLPLLPAEDPEARAAVDAGQTYISDVFTSGMTHPFLMRVVVPATVGGESGWAVEVTFTPDQVRAWLNPGETPPGWAVTVVGGNGLIVARNRAQDDYVGRGTSRDMLDPVSGLTGAWHGTMLDGSSLAGIYLPLAGTSWIVTVGAAEAALNQPREMLLLRLAAVALALVGLSALVSALLARRIERDMAALARTAETLAAGPAATASKLSVPILSVVEFEAVSRALGGAGRDIQARGHRERALLEEARSNRDLLRAVVDGTVDPIFARDLQGRFVLVNRAGAAVLGIAAAEDMIGRRAADIVKMAGSDAMLHWDQVTAPGAPSAADAGLIDIHDEATGVSRLFQVKKSAWLDNDGRMAGIVCVARDITERATAEARLRTLQEDLTRAGRLSAVAAMAAGLAHELNQPLSAASNFLAAAESMIRTGTAPEQLTLVRETMSEAAAQMLRAADIVRHLRHFIGRDGVAMQEEVLAPLVAEAAQAAWHYAAGPAAKLNLHLDPAAAALADPVQLQQVVANLVRNAAEALQAGSGRNEVWICLAQTEDGGSIIDVSDTGPGLDPARRERLFDVFEHSGRSEEGPAVRAKKAGGLGVGLAICRTIVAAHGGRIWAEDNPGGGAVFRFTLPAIERRLHREP